MKEYENKTEITVNELIEILQELEHKEAIVLNDNGKNIRIYCGRENKKGGRPIITIC